MARSPMFGFLYMESVYQENTAISTAGKYVLFQCHHLSTLFQFVLLRCTRYRSHKVVLLVYNDLFCRSPFARELERGKIFDRILEIREPKNFEEKQHELFVTDYYNRYFETHGLSFDDMLEIYVACDLNNLFPVYCTLNNRAVSYIEMYEGQLRDKNRYCFCTTAFGYPSWIETLYRKYHTLSGCDDRYTVKRYLWPGSITEYPEKDIHMDFLREFYALPNQRKKQIADCMALPAEVDFHEVEILLMNSPKWTKSICGLEPPQHYLPYLLVADYYFDSKNFFIKNHPHANADTYFVGEIAQRANTIPATIPIEFFGLIDNFRIKKLISVASSGNLKISEFVSEEITLSENYLCEYSSIHKCYISLRLAHDTGDSFSTQGIGIRNDFIQKLRSCTFGADPISVSGTGRNRIYQFVGTMVADTKEHVLPPLFPNDRVTVFLDAKSVTDALEQIQNHTLLQRLIGIEIRKEAIYDSILSDTQTEYLFLFCTDEAYIRRISGRMYEYTLPHTGLRITAKAAECDAQLLSSINHLNDGR